MWQDLHYALRTLRRNPGFTLVILLSLGVGIGANTAIFSAFDQVLLQTLPVPEPDRLVMVRRTSPQGAVSRRFSPAVFEQLQAHSRSFAGMFAHDGSSTVLTIDGTAEIVPSAFASGSYYTVLGIGAIAGRVFTPQDDRPGAPPVAVLRYEYWKQRFGLDPQVIGRSIEIKGVPFTIIGVTPPLFSGFAMFDPANITIPFAWQPALGLKDHADAAVAGRLAPGVSAGQAASELKVIYQGVLRHSTGTNITPERERSISAQSIVLAPGGRGLTGIQEEQSLRVMVLMGAVGMLLLAACANIAGLLLARATARQKEMAIRVAIGAGRARLLRQMLTESLVLSCLGGAAGLLFQQWGRELLPALLGLPVQGHLSAHVLLFTVAVSLITGVLFGIIPAVRTAGVDPVRSIKSSGAPSSAPSGGLLGRALIAGQVALSVCILIGAGLLLRTVRNLESVETGFRSDRILLGWVFPTLAGYEGPTEVRFYDDLIRSARAVPGVLDVTVGRHSMMQGNGHTTVDTPAHDTEPLRPAFNAIGPGFFETMGIPVLRGRDFQIRDRLDSPAVAIVNESLARTLYAAGDPIGKRILSGGERAAREIVGVVSDTRWHSLRQAETPLQLYLPYAQTVADELGQMQLITRVAAAPDTVLPELRKAVAAVDPHVPLVHVTTQASQVRESASDERSLATLTSVFGVLALVLAAMGLYATVSYSVNRRTAEIGIRMALGAQESSVLWLILRETLAIAWIGIFAGVPAALAGSRLISSFLYGVGAFDAPTLAGVLLVILSGTAIAGYLPARRASRVDPLIALHHE